MNRHASIPPPPRDGACFDKDLVKQVECQLRFDEAAAKFEQEPTSENYEARAMARTRLGRAQHDVRRQPQVVVQGLPVRRPTPRRVPRSRGAAHRPGAKPTARAGPPPPDDPDEPEPPRAAASDGGAP